MTRLARLLLVMALALLGACSGGGDAEEGDSPGGTDEQSDDSGEVDSCTLLSNEEVSALAGYELAADEDSPLGCPYIAPGENVADVRVVAVISEGGAMAVAERGFPDAAEIMPVSVGEDTVAVTDPAGDAIASIVTASGDRVVELSVIFIDVPPDDPTRIEEAANLAVTALERFGG